MQLAHRPLRQSRVAQLNKLWKEGVGSGWKASQVWVELWSTHCLAIMPNKVHSPNIDRLSWHPFEPLRHVVLSRLIWQPSETHVRGGCSRCCRPRHLRLPSRPRHPPVPSPCAWATMESTENLRGPRGISSHRCRSHPTQQAQLKIGRCPLLVPNAPNWHHPRDTHAEVPPPLARSRHPPPPCSARTDPFRRGLGFHRAPPRCRRAAATAAGSYQSPPPPPQCTFAALARHRPRCCRLGGPRLQ